MTRKLIATSLLLGLVLFIFASPTTASTLSNTYYTAFTDPYGFDAKLNSEFANSPYYNNNFMDCLQTANQSLARLERQLRQEHSVCPNNARCTQLAKEIKNVMDLRLNLGNLGKYISAKRSGSTLSFPNSDIGQAATYVYNFHRNNRIDLLKNPVFTQWMGILNSIPCK